MGTPSSALAPAPSPLVAGFLRWVTAHYGFRVGECPLVRATTYYFAQAGNDSTGDGSQANPWKTLAKVNSVIIASTGNIACLLNRGDTWRESTALSIGKADVTLGAYGSGEKPVITRFTQQYSSGWTATGSGSYYHAEATEIAWVREVGDEYTPYSLATSAANCDATARSWWWDSGASRLYVNAGGSRNPNTLSLEAVPHQSADGVSVADVDGVRVDSIVQHGGGTMSPSHSSQHTYGFHTIATGTNATVFSSCESYYSGYHAFGSTPDSGGVATFVDCTSGFCRGADDGGYDFIFYSLDGGNEAISANNTALYGPLPGTSGGPVYAHTGTDGATHSLILESNFSIAGGTYGHNGAGGFDNLPAASGDVSDVRGFIIGRKVGSATTPLTVSTGSITLSDADTFQANSVIYVSCVSGSGQEQLSSLKAGDGWFVNGSLVMVYSSAAPKICQNQSGKRQRFWHSHFVFKDFASNYSGFEMYSTDFVGSPVDVEVHQCIIQGINSSNIRPCINNNVDSGGTALNPLQQTGNAYVDILGGIMAYQGTNNDTRAVTPDNTPTVPEFPDASYLVSGGLSLVGYDGAGATRMAGEVVVGPLAGTYAPTPRPINLARNGLGLGLNL
jgi:hypothetical protein